MMATGVRIGETLALYWEDVDLDASTVQIDWTVVRVRGEGLRRTDPKSSAGERTLMLPSWAVDMLNRRRKIAEAENRPAASPVFLIRSGGCATPRTHGGHCGRPGSAEFSWVTSHVFRKTASTVLDEAKLSAR